MCSLDPVVQSVRNNGPGEEELRMNREEVILGDAEIRSALRARLLIEHRGDADTVIMEELGFCRGQVRIDMAVVNGFLHGYEIKSDRDSLRRLGVQTDYYNKVLDRATLVVGERHVEKTIDLVPGWWEILRVEASPTGPKFRTMRRGRKNPGRDPRALVELIWLDDAVALLEQRGAARGMRSKPRRVVWDRVCEHFGLKEISETVRDHLKARAASQDPALLS